MSLVPKKEILDFLDDLQWGILHNGIKFEPSEIREFIAQQTQLGEALYKKVETLYNAALEAQGHMSQSNSSKKYSPRRDLHP